MTRQGCLAPSHMQAALDQQQRLRLVVQDLMDMKLTG